MTIQSDVPEWTNRGEFIAPGAFKHQADTIVPVRLREGGPIIGEARVSEDGEMINIELKSGTLPKEFAEMFKIGYADSFSIRPNFAPAVSASPRAMVTQEGSTSRWNQNTPNKESK